MKALIFFSFILYVIRKLLESNLIFAYICRDVKTSQCDIFVQASSCSNRYREHQPFISTSSFIFK